MKRKFALPAEIALSIAVGCGEGSDTLTSHPPSSTPSSTVAPTDCETSESVKHDIGAAIVTVLSYDYRSLDAYPDRVRAVTTPAFFAMLSKTFNTAVRPLAQRYDAVSTADVTTVSYDSGECHHPVYVANLTQRVSNTKLPRPRVDRVTVKVRTAFTDGRYRIAHLDAL